MTRMSAKHTPGPWEIIGGSRIWAEHIRVASVVAIGGGEGAANARLIAAAPEQNEVLEAVRDYLANEADVPGITGQVALRLLHRVEEVLAKATGFCWLLVCAAMSGGA